MSETLLELSVVAGPHQGDLHATDGVGRLLVGKDPAADVRLERDPTVSRRHCMLRVGFGVVLLEDLSKNGTEVDGVVYGGRMEPREGVRVAPGRTRNVLLQDGSEFRVGDSRLRVSLRLPWRKRPADTPTEQLSPHAFRSRELPDGLGYDLGKLLSDNGPVRVYEAEREGQPVALKVLGPTPPGELARAFEREASLALQVAGHLQHPNLVRVLETGAKGPWRYLAMELVTGGDLLGLLDRRGGRLELSEAGPIVCQASRGVAHAHRAELVTEVVDPILGETTQRTFRGLVHRDLKPGNILLQRRGNGWLAKVADFGLAKLHDAAGLTQFTKEGYYQGTPPYSAPEQVTGYRYAGPAADVYSLGATLYSALGGRYPRGSMEDWRAVTSTADALFLIMEPVVPLAEVAPEVPPCVQQVVERALADDPSRRYSDAGAFEEALSKALRESGVDPDPPASAA